MKFIRNKAQKRTQQIMQALESRRLMSLTAGAEIMPPPAPMSPSVHFNHSFGFEQAQRDGGSMGVNVGFDPNGQFPPVHGDFAGGFPDAGRADASAVPTAITAPAPAAAVESTGVTLSQMYSTFGTSTVAQIDAASTHSLASVVNDSLADRTGGSFTTQLASPSVGSLAIASQNVMEPESIVTSDKALATAMTVFATPNAIEGPLAFSSASESAPPSWAGLHKLEDELTAVRAIADQVISELGRDGAIALSHLEEVMDPKTVVHAIAGNWKSAAVIAGTIAAVSLVKNDGEKKVTPFSSRLIENVLG